jgi:hypothetical protein
MKSEGFNERRELIKNKEQGTMSKEKGEMLRKPAECQCQLMYRGWLINEQGTKSKEQGEMLRKPAECQRQLMYRGWHINEHRVKLLKSYCLKILKS